ncbi:asparagine synthetase B family protein [Actinomadura parmotrematis]|uniref:asparagine synthase (glutamine-hydrolyzing) n=1 Tax=Actinomadura parmotrematis TaxID=2864039 RepID=A0ABS7G3L9_9ACTN|nr:asparagine synthetase B [Actinomadura parmotrematis]MBW8487303.1 asparagine synthetase B [Actinomadura parmotrematis]
MGDLQQYRGPDGTGVTAAADGRAVLAMNTLRIVNPAAPPGPYQDEASGLLLAFNGEIYNWRRLALNRRIPMSDADTDAHLLLGAWARYGPSCLPELDGMFAAALYDPGKGRAGTLYLLRDRLGEKPLYWRLDGGRLAFASEVTTLARYGAAPVVLRPEMQSIETPTGTDTPFQGIQLLAPGTLLEFDVATGSLAHHSWWELAAVTPLDGHLTYDQAVNHTADLLTEHAPLRVPCGDWALLLSGGLDSATLAHLMRPPVCITVRYPGQDRLDESALARQTADRIGAELLVVEPTPEDLQQTLPQIAAALDYPMGNAAVFSEYMAYQTAAARGLRVVAGGLGPDELLMGYVRHALALHGPEAVLQAGLVSYRPLAERLVDTWSPLESLETITRLITRGPDPDQRVRALVAAALVRAHGDVARALTLVELATAWRPLVETSDKLASALALERRSPYLATALVEFAYALPTDFKTRGPAYGKRVLRDAALRLGVPPSVCANPDKLGFASPVPQWLNGPLATWTDQHLTKARSQAPAALHPLLNAGLVRRSRFDRTRMQALITAAWVLNSPAVAPIAEGTAGATAA